MGLTAVFLCPESHRTQIRGGEEGGHGFDSRLSQSHIVLRLERGEEGGHGFDSRLSVPRVTSLERGREGARKSDSRLSVPRVTSYSDLREERKDLMGLTAVFLCPESRSFNQVLVTSLETYGYF
ncbi:hypothetical protein J6590_083658 [Homalodisca vitripennis]|nr:hypothetical protein J6590_083658 [Homalodisca vitripennis]